MIADGFVDAGEFLVDDAAGTDIEMAYFGISHLAIGEANIFSMGH
jgi:hypothetical protein